jgi:hypothetical protein
VKSLRRGMLLRDREQLRTEVLARQISQAYERSARYGLSGQCAAAMELTGEQARVMHESCLGEEPGGLGCLCTHHDVARTQGQVVTGSLSLPALPQ